MIGASAAAFEALAAALLPTSKSRLLFYPLLDIELVIADALPSRSTKRDSRIEANIRLMAKTKLLMLGSPMPLIASVPSSPPLAAGIVELAAI